MPTLAKAGRRVDRWLNKILYLDVEDRLSLPAKLEEVPREKLGAVLVCLSRQPKSRMHYTRP